MSQEHMNPWKFIVGMLLTAVIQAGIVVAIAFWSVSTANILVGAVAGAAMGAVSILAGMWLAKK